MFLVHQVLPHRHHQHDDEHSHNAVAHSDTHDHHHNVPEKESSNKGFLGLFLEMHVHSVASTEIVVTQNSNINQLKVEKVVKTPISTHHYSMSTHYDEAGKSKVYHPPNKYFNSYLSALDTRGPPTLG